MEVLSLSALVLPDQAAHFCALCSVFLDSLFPESLLLWLPFRTRFSFNSFIKPKLASTCYVLDTHLGCKYINEKNKDPCIPGTYIPV